jgi:enoyl-CoA hydratase/carnithine racemase
MADAMLRHDEDKGVHRLTMNHGPNALDRPMMAAMRGELRRLAEGGAPAVILASAHPTLFCPGWNLKLLAEAPREDVRSFLAEFNALILELFSYPGPTAAEVGGHAVAAGCQMTIACDVRVMASGVPRLGLSELNLGVPVPGASLRMLRSRLSSPAVDDLVFRGEGCTAARARELGLVHRTAPPGELTGATAHETTRLAGRPRRAFVETKRLLLSAVWVAMAEPAPSEDEAFLDCWFEEETRRRIAGVSSRLGA